MKRISVWCLLLVMLMTAALPALGETAEGVGAAWVTFGKLGFSFAIPDTWYEYEFEDEMKNDSVLLLAANEAESQWIYVYMREVENATLADVEAEFAENPEYYENLRRETHGSFEMLRYDISSEGFFGALMVTADGNYIIYFDFNPLEDENLALLADEILNTLEAL